jgi:hypothetical protein
MSLLPEAVQEHTNTAGIASHSSKTYFLDFNTGVIHGLVDGEIALKQAIRKAIITNMHRPLIYDGAYGSELETLIGSSHSVAYLRSEVPRMIKDALVYDDRIEDVADFNVSISGDVVYVEFLVVLTDGTKITIAEAVSI